MELGVAEKSFHLDEEVVAEVAELKAKHATWEAIWAKRVAQISEANSTLKEHVILLDDERKKPPGACTRSTS